VLLHNLLLLHALFSSRMTRRRYVVPDPVLTTIYGLQMEGNDPGCGLPCKYCHAQAPVCVGAGGLGAGLPPPELEGLYSEA
jgi:hypothetical protein